MGSPKCRVAISQDVPIMRPEWVEEVWKQVNIIIDIDISTNIIMDINIDISTNINININININNILVTVCSLTTVFPKLDNIFRLFGHSLEFVCL